MANKIMEVTSLLKLTPYEEFKIQKYYDVFRFTDSEFQVFTSKGWVKASSLILADLIYCGEITRLPYSPKRNERYWTYVDKTWFPASFYWGDSPIDYSALYSGMVFRSYEEAIAGRADVYRKLTGREWKGE